jgi:uncharacterized protein (TIGR03437 family)
LLSAVVNGASFQTGAVAPGSLISIFGVNLASSGTPGGVALAINGVPAPLQFVSPRQINAQVPFETIPGTAIAELRSPGMPPAAIQFPIVQVAPAIFANGRAAVQNADGAMNATDHPAEPGSTVTVYLTGQGMVEPPVANGEPAPNDPVVHSSYPVTATIGGQPAEVLFAGLDAGSVGVFRVTIRAPLVEPGTYSLDVFINGVASSTQLVSIAGSK